MFWDPGNDPETLCVDDIFGVDPCYFNPAMTFCDESGGEPCFMEDFTVAAEGTVLVAAQDGPASMELLSELSQGELEVAGVAYERICRGFVVARSYSAAEAAQIRRETEEIALH
ncbi:MAG: hypothetical protein RLN75_08410 [Longimicrobiales bacterium]